MDSIEVLDPNKVTKFKDSKHFVYPQVEEKRLNYPSQEWWLFVSMNGITMQNESAILTRMLETTGIGMERVYVSTAAQSVESRKEATKDLGSGIWFKFRAYVCEHSTEALLNIAIEQMRQRLRCLGGDLSPELERLLVDRK